MAKLSPQAVEHIYQSLRGLRDGEVKPIAGQLAAHYGVALQTIYRAAARRGLTWRKARKDKGTSKASGSAITRAGALVYAARRTTNDFPLPACDAMEILEDSGIELGVSTERAVSLLRERRISARHFRQPTPHVTLLSEHPNHVWQFDVTNCLQYFLDDKGMGERDADMELYKNRIVDTAKKIKRKLLRFAAVDHCTGAFYFRYFYATGERAIDGAQFLYEAFRPKDELIERTWNGESGPKLGKYRFHGVPFIIVPDKGSIMNDRANQNLFDSLRIEIRPHLPGNPRAKGAVEGLMHHLNRFEARLKFQRPRDLDVLNRWALDYCIKCNAVNKMRGVAPRSALWSYITDEQLRLCPGEDVYRMLIRRPVIESKANGACVITINRQHYRIPDSNAAHQKVKTVINPYEYPKVEVHFNGFVWLLEPIAQDKYGRLSDGVTYGEYKSPRHTATQRAMTEMEEIVEKEWGLSWKGTAQKRRAEAPPVGHEGPLKVFDHQADKVPAPLTFIQRKGTELDVKQPEVESSPLRSDAIEVPRTVADRRITIMAFLKRLRAETGNIPPALNQAIRARYGDSISIKEAEEVMDSIRKTGQLPGEDPGRESAAL